ncbi:hypothetical protein HNV11_00975 [Spirosoma taeanense]|uniref:UrcA family protein n=1 Tax=Spirosoma taeanense TaxID=2735870 RepID=A0A6M5Y4L6_9BACT|nr:hypothetical protein [Spirosoma taeanense]QJW88043.1 hypothetical protein HNV11_00975 [Spirosoma taeanense]
MSAIPKLRFAITAALFALVSFASQAQTKNDTVTPRDGFWVIETPAKSRQCTVRFYTSRSELIYEETINRCLNVARRQTKRQLNVALEQAMYVWNATHKVPTDRQWVAIQFEKK